MCDGKTIKMKPTHLNSPLVAGCSTDHKPRLSMLADRSWVRKYISIGQIHFFQRWFQSFLVVLAMLLCMYVESWVYGRHLNTKPDHYWTLAPNEVTSASW